MIINPQNVFGNFRPAEDNLEFVVAPYKPHPERDNSLEPWCRPVICKPPTLNRGYNRGPNSKTLKGRRPINHGSAL